MQIKKLSLGPLGTNCYIVYENGKAIIFDPGHSGERVKSFLRSTNLSPIAIILTHAHFDHIGAVDDLREEYSIEVYLHPVEHSWLVDSNLNGSRLFGVSNPIELKPAEHELKEGILTISEFKFKVIHTPGHSPGSMSFVFEDHGFVIAGDTLFQRGIGRTDLPGGNHQELLKSIQLKMLTLPDDMIVYPGHGPKTTIKEERELNPFLNM
jgi:hydroxyacylglutathione hydrolase